MSEIQQRFFIATTVRFNVIEIDWFKDKVVYGKALSRANRLFKAGGVDRLIYGDNFLREAGSGYAEHWFSHDGEGGLFLEMFPDQDSLDARLQEVTRDERVEMIVGRYDDYVNGDLPGIGADQVVIDGVAVEGVSDDSLYRLVDGA